MRPASDRSKDGTLTGHANDIPCCPQCGAEHNPRAESRKTWMCHSYIDYATGDFIEDEECLRLQLAAVTKDRDELAAAIATPEVYAEVVTRVLEEDRGKLLYQLKTVTAERDAANKLLSGRAGKLLKKGKTFVVVSVTEPYFRKAYEMIRAEEVRKGTWTQEDTDLRAAAVHEWADMRIVAKADARNVTP